MVYGLNRTADREVLWQQLGQISMTISGAWCMMGDFNAISNPNDRIRGLTVTNADIQPMRRMMEECEVEDLKTKGAFYTWNNKQDVDHLIYSRIDRVLINEEWLALFPRSFAHLMPEGIYDHCPCFVQFEEVLARKAKAFKYFNMWRLAENYDSAVEGVWRQEKNGNMMYIIVSKLK